MFKFLKSLIISIMASSSIHAQDYVRIDSLAPQFTALDVYGTQIKLSELQGKKVLLTFYRNVGCPVCNLRFHEMEKLLAKYDTSVIALAVYESSSEHISAYLGTDTYKAIIIPNPLQDLYRLYHVERSTVKIMKGLFNGAFTKMTKGNKLFKRKIKQDGNMDRLEADFLIDAHGKVARAHWARFLGDHIPLAEVEEFIKH